MSETKVASNWKLIIYAIFTPILIFMGIDFALGADVGSDAFKRFGNAVLTAYTLASGLLLVNIFFYADSRHRPLAPAVSMVFVTLAGAGLTMFLLSNGDLLMEENGSARAQALYNVVRFLVSSAAILFASAVVMGLSFTALTSAPIRSFFDEEE